MTIKATANKIYRHALDLEHDPPLLVESLFGYEYEEKEWIGDEPHAAIAASYALYARERDQFVEARVAVTKDATIYITVVIPWEDEDGDVDPAKKAKVRFSNHHRQTTAWTGHIPTVVSVDTEGVGFLSSNLGTWQTQRILKQLRTAVELLEEGVSEVEE